MLIAAKNGRLETVKFLIENGCSIDEKDRNGNTYLLLAAAEKYTDSYIYHAPNKGQFETVQWLLESGCSIHEKNNDGYSAMLVIALNGNLEMLKLLFENGGSIHTKIKTDIHACYSLQMKEFIQTFKNSEMVKNGCSTD